MGGHWQKNEYIAELESLPFARGVHVGPQSPLHVGLFLVEGAQLDLEELHLEAGAHLLDDHLAASLFVDVVAEGNEVVSVAEGDHSLGVLLGHRKQIFEDCQRLPSKASDSCGPERRKACLRVGLERESL